MNIKKQEEKNKIDNKHMKYATLFTKMKVCKTEGLSLC